MTPDDPMFQRAVYAFLIPGVLGLVASLVLLAVRGGRLAVVAVPAAAAAGVVVCFWQPFHAVPEPGSFGGAWARWKWLVPSLVALLAAWPVAVMLPRRGWAVAGGLLLLVLAGLLVGPARYDETKGQPWVYVVIAPLALLVLASLVLPAARRAATAGDAAAMGVVGVLSVPTLALAEFHGAVVLYAPVVAATLGAAVAAVVMRGPRLHARSALAAGTFVLPLAAVPTAVVVWLVQSDLQKVDSVLLATPAVAGVASVVLPRLRRTHIGVLAAVLLGGFGLVVTLVLADVSPYVTPPAWAEPWLGAWSTPPAPVVAPIDVSDEANFWGG